MSFNRRRFYDVLKDTDGIEFSEAQIALIDGADTGDSHQQSTVHAARDLYVTERYQRIADEIGVTVDGLRKANESHAKSLRWATWVLAGATCVLAFATLGLMFFTAFQILVIQGWFS